ncbi:Xaa-Pro peptidase family protein [Victivallis sp. Marseille-Q1083]|uniref:M24 family metallopeptidase n=1 Tax=Victivallis sp. Marseille-Q1083 TaxID=2717288 RepID=UPI0015896B87|nr:Xaa-Pro peptidase family protein [Victivallis sp. Marseille-Q1083]
MSYLIASESEQRLDAVKKLLEAKNLDLALVYYDECNLANGWYLTGWCPQFESGAVLVPRKGPAMLLGGPESEPFARQDSAVKNTRNFPVFMVPDEEYPAAEIIGFPELFAELQQTLGSVRRIGLVGGDRMPYRCRREIEAGFAGVEISDITTEFLAFRAGKSPWEIEQIRAAFKLADFAYEAMKAKIAVGNSEIEVAAAGEYAARSRGATGFGFTAIVGSGSRSNAVVPTSTNKIMQDGEMVMIGIAPKVCGYAGVVGDALPVNGVYSARQIESMKYLREAFVLTREKLQPGLTGREIDAPARRYFRQHGFESYLVCPFAHTIGLNEAEGPFFGPNSDDVLEPGMTVCVDISFFGHPEFNGIRIESGYEITAAGAVPFSPALDKRHSDLDHFEF